MSKLDAQPADLALDGYLSVIDSHSSACCSLWTKKAEKSLSFLRYRSLRRIFQVNVK